MEAKIIVRRTARILSELHPVSKTAVWNWIKKFEEKLSISAKKKHRNLEKQIPISKKQYFWLRIENDRAESPAYFNPKTKSRV